jgi:hypothetical protein
VPLAAWLLDMMTGLRLQHLHSSEALAAHMTLVGFVLRIFSISISTCPVETCTAPIRVGNSLTGTHVTGEMIKSVSGWMKRSAQDSLRLLSNRDTLPSVRPFARPALEKAAPACGSIVARTGFRWGLRAWRCILLITATRKASAAGHAD